MDNLLSGIFFRNPVWSIHFQLISPKIQQGQSAVSSFLHTFNMGCLLSVDFSTDSKCLVYFQLSFPQMQIGHPAVS